MSNPPGEREHEVYVCLNGDSPHEKEAKKLFSAIGAQFFTHNNWARDLGGFMLGARLITCDLLVCMGAHVNFRRPCWLDWILAVAEKQGPAVGGAWGIQVPEQHLRTTFFWTPPYLLRHYPYLKADSDRYGFEHGRNNIALWTQRLGFEPYQLTWGGVYQMKDWHVAPLQDCLARDQHTLRDFGE